MAAAPLIKDREGARSCVFDAVTTVYVMKLCGNGLQAAHMADSSPEKASGFQDNSIGIMRIACGSGLARVRVNGVS
jgi:hypothetical protein